MSNNNEQEYKELLDTVRPFFPNDLSQAHAVITQKIGPILSDILLQLVWKQLELEDGFNWMDTLPYKVCKQCFSKN